MVQQYGTSCMSERRVYQWVERRTSVVYEQRSVRHFTVVTDEIALILEDRQISIATVANTVNISIGYAHPSSDSAMSLSMC